MFEKFFDHEFWKLLEMGRLSRMAKSPDLVNGLARILVKGFYPISLVAPIVFGAVFEATGNKQAEFLWLTEMGENPPFGTHKGVAHSELFLMMVRCLTHDDLQPDTELVELYLNELEPAKNLCRALAIGDVIEHVAPGIVHRMANAVAGAQVAVPLDASRIDSAWLSEHLLSEGTGHGQHIAVVQGMTAQHPEVLGQESEAEQSRYIDVTHKHLDRALKIS